MHIQRPQDLEDDEWADEVQNLHYIRQLEKKATEQ